MKTRDKVSTSTILNNKIKLTSILKSNNDLKI